MNVLSFKRSFFSLEIVVQFRDCGSVKGKFIFCESLWEILHFPQAVCETKCDIDVILCIGKGHRYLVSDLSFKIS